MAETGLPADKTINLTSDFLGASDHRNLSAEGALRAPSMGTHRREFTESGNAHELRSQAIAANLADDKDAPIILSASQQAKRENQTSTVKARRREEQQRTQLTIVEQARQLSERLGRQIAAMERDFQAQFGDAWREEIANRVMDPDDIPQRRAGESMQDYRDRLEATLIATMIDENGEIRPEYANSDDPDIRRYAEWAQAQHAQNGLDNASPDELERNVQHARDVESLYRSGRAQDEQGEHSTSVDTRTDAYRNSGDDLSTENAAFAPPPAG